MCNFVRFRRQLFQVKYLSSMYKNEIKIDRIIFLKNQLFYLVNGEIQSKKFQSNRP